MMWREVLRPCNHQKITVRDEDETVPFVVQYPPGFDVSAGMGLRIAFLNNCLLKDYVLLGQMIRYRHNKRQAYNKAFDRGPTDFPLKEDYLDWVLSDITAANSSIKSTVRTIIYQIGEIDAVAGQKAFFIPEELKVYIEPHLSYLVESRSLAYLAESQYYIGEEYPPVNPEERNSYGFLAYTINRISYFVACDCKQMVKFCEECLRTCYYSLSFDRIQCMPLELKNEAVKLLSHMWIRMKEEALKKMNDESEEEILCLSDSDLKRLEQEFRRPDVGRKKRSRKDKGQYEELKKSEAEMDRVVQKKHHKKKPKMQKEQELKKVTEEKVKGANEKDQDKVEEKDKGANEKNQDKEVEDKKQTVKFKGANEKNQDKEVEDKKQTVKLVGDAYTEDTMDNLGEDEEGGEYDDDYPYDTDDSNAEDNPLYDYPDEDQSDDDHDFEDPLDNKDDDFEEQLDDEDDHPD